MAALAAGSLDRRIVLERRVPKLDAGGTGEDVGDWAPIATVWAQKLDIRGTESFLASQRYAQVTTRFRIRWRADVTPTIRVLYGERVFDVVEVLEIGRREGLDILATAPAA